MTTPLMSRRRAIAVAVESTKGTAETLSATDATSLVYDPKIAPTDFYPTERAPANASGGEIARVREARKASATFQTEVLYQDLTKTLLSACGMKLTSSQADPTLVESEQKTLTIALWEGGRKKVCYGASGSVSFSTDNAGGRLLADWTFTGLWVSVVDQAIPSVTPVLSGGFRNRGLTATLGGAAIPPIAGFSIDLGADVQMREDSTASEGIGYFYVADLRPKLTIAPEAAVVSEYDAFGKLDAGTVEALVLSLVNSSANVLTFSGPKLQRIGGGATEDRGGKLVDPFEFAFTVSAGNDHIRVLEAVS